jgi:glycosyltransferase involved in cell wall biosynthesis
MLSLCLTNYNRYELLLESFQAALQDHRVTEIVISDDCSTKDIYQKLVAYCDSQPKIKLFRNDYNMGMGLNKKMVIERASGDYDILFDSDNVVTGEYLDACFGHHHYPNVINVPDFAMPDFDYRLFSAWLISTSNIRHFLNRHPMATCLLNTCNYVVNRQRYLDVYEHNASMKGTDTIWFNYCWLKGGNFFFVVPGMQYQHRNHPGSGFLQDVDYNMARSREMVQLIKAL